MVKALTIQKVGPQSAYKPPPENMVKKSSTTRRGIQGQSVKKHKIRSKAAEKDKGSDLIDFENGYVFGRIKYRQLFQMGQKWFHYAADQSTKLGLVPFERIYHNSFARLSQKRLLLHYAVILVLTVAMIYKLWAMIKFVSGQHVLTVETFMCISLFLVSFVAWSMSLVLVYFSDETLTMLNIWTPYLECTGIQSGNVVCRTSTALQLITFVQMCHAIAIVVSLISLIFNALPVCVFPALENLGLIPDLPVPRILWQVIFFPLELLLNMMSMYHAALSGHLLCIGFDTHAIALFEMRKVRVTDMAGRLKLEEMYIRLEVYNRVFANWLRIMIAPSLFTASCAIVIALYVTVRHTDLPWFLYVIFPYVGVTLLVIIFWISYNGVINMRDSEAILGDLKSLLAPQLAMLSIPERRKLIKRVKACRPITCPMGPFADLSFMLPLGVWDEVLNQLLFLLSL